MIDQSFFDVEKYNTTHSIQINETIDLNNGQDKPNSFCFELVKMDSRIKSVFWPDLYAEFHNSINYFNNKYIMAYIPFKNVIIISDEVPSLQHEIAHMVEMKDISRVIKPDWGLNSIASNIPKKAKTFFAMVAREIRVFSIQDIINDKYFHLRRRGIESMIFQMNNNWYQQAYSYLPYGRFKIKKDFIDWSQSIHEKTIKSWSKDRVETEWKIRLEYLQNWMETKELAAALMSRFKSIFDLLTIKQIKNTLKDILFDVKNNKYCLVCNSKKIKKNKLIHEKNCPEKK